MAKFRATRAPERQVDAVVGRLVNLGVLRRGARRRDRERHARIRRSLDNARAAAERFAASRDRYRDLALLVEAALLARPPSDDFGGLAERVARALQQKGCVLPDMPPRMPTSSRQRAPPKQPNASR